MQIVNQSHEILTTRTELLMIPKMIEVAGRTCYKSENRITNGSCEKFCRMIIKRGHEAMLEHGSITVRFITDRGVSHELVRHRIASFAQESTRYVNYKNADMKFIRPAFDWAFPIAGKESAKMTFWKGIMIATESAYKVLIGEGCTPQEARSVLPNSLKTEIVVTANIREWRKIFSLRTAEAAHPQIRTLMNPLLDECARVLPSLFEDIKEDRDAMV